MRRLTQEEFLERSAALHGTKYNYTKAQYHSLGDKVIIICDVHGEFRQYAWDHLRGRGCIKCGHISMIEKRQASKER